MTYTETVQNVRGHDNNIMCFLYVFLEHERRSNDRFVLDRRRYLYRTDLRGYTLAATIIKKIFVRGQAIISQSVQATVHNIMIINIIMIVIMKYVHCMV